MIPTNFKATPDESRAGALTLIRRQDCHRSQTKGSNCPGLGKDRQIAKQDVADDLAVAFGNQGEAHVAALTQGINQASFRILTEGEAVDHADCFVIGRSLGSDQHLLRLVALAPDHWLLRILRVILIRHGHFAQQEA